MIDDVVLVQAPHAKACEPAPGLPVLAEHLRRAGHSVRIFDANLEVQEALLSGNRMRRELEQLASRGAARSWLTSGHRVTGQATLALETLRDPATWDEARTYRHAVGVLTQAYRLLSRSTGTRISVSDLDCPHLSPLSSHDLMAAAANPGALPFGDELESLVPRILAGNPRVVGVSAVYLSQALPAFALAGLLRRGGFDGLLVLGGGVVSSWAPRLAPTSPIFQIWDALVAGPGEDALIALLQGDDARCRAAPGLLAPPRQIWNKGTALPTVCFEPDPEGFPWERYWGPGPILPIAASRGCYWARCAFCPEASEGRQRFQSASPEALAKTILRARDRYGFRHVHLTDDAIPPATLRRLAVALRDEGISWYGFARLGGRLLEASMAEDLARGGCAMLQMGVETASQRLLDLLGKGTRVDDAAPTLRNLTDAGIRTHVYLLFGVPTETPDEARDTLQWACDHAETITFLNLALMNLPKGSPLERDADRYGVKSLEPVSQGKDLSLYWTFQGEGSTGRKDMRRVLAEAKAHPVLSRILARTPPGFTSNHGAWAPLEDLATRWRDDRRDHPPPRPGPRANEREAIR